MGFFETFKTLKPFLFQCKSKESLSFFRKKPEEFWRIQRLLCVAMCHITWKMHYDNNFSNLGSFEMYKPLKPFLFQCKPKESSIFFRKKPEELQMLCKLLCSLWGKMPELQKQKIENMSIFLASWMHLMVLIDNSSFLW